MSAVIRYLAPGWPAMIPGHASFVPHLNRHAGSGAYQYKDGVIGQPGTQAIPTAALSSATIPGGGAETPSPAVAMMGLGRSVNAPERFFPNLYWARPQRMYWPGAGMPVSVQSDNLMPVPAADPRGIPSTQYMPIVQRGQQQIGTAPNMPRWPWWNRSG